MIEEIKIKEDYDRIIRICDKFAGRINLKQYQEKRIDNLFRLVEKYELIHEKW